MDPENDSAIHLPLCLNDIQLWATYLVRKYFDFSVEIVSTYIVYSPGRYVMLGTSKHKSFHPTSTSRDHSTP
jgi:hypothetical protein